MAKDVHGQDYTEIVDEMGTWWEYTDGIKIIVQPTQLWLDQNVNMMQLANDPNGVLKIRSTNLKLNLVYAKTDNNTSTISKIENFLRSKYPDYI